MYTKVDSTITIGDLIAGKDYRVVVYFDGSELRGCLFGLAEERSKKEC